MILNHETNEKRGKDHQTLPFSCFSCVSWLSAQRYLPVISGKFPLPAPTFGQLYPSFFSYLCTPCSALVQLKCP